MRSRNWGVALEGLDKVTERYRDIISSQVTLVVYYIYIYIYICIYMYLYGSSEAGVGSCLFGGSVVVVWEVGRLLGRAREARAREASDERDARERDAAAAAGATLTSRLATCSVSALQTSH